MRAEVVLLVSLTAFIPASLTRRGGRRARRPDAVRVDPPGRNRRARRPSARLGPFRFLLDTGSTHTAVTERLATAVDAVPVARTVMRAAAGSVGCLVVALPTVVVDGVSADGLTATALPQAAAAALGPGVDGVLGQDFLSRFTFTIDYRRSQIVWHDADYVAPGTRLALVPAQDRWLVELPQPATAPGTAPTLRRFVPDSGADTLVLFGERRAGCLITAWRARHVRAGIADRRARGEDGDRRRAARRRGHARWPGRGGRAVDRARRPGRPAAAAPVRERVLQREEPRAGD